MGMYLNPGNSGFTGIRNDTYVDKSGLISLINDTIDTPRRLTCISRPRRFGKSFAAKMLCAYYDKTCDSSALFDDLRIAADENMNGSYRKHLNQYDVIYLDMTNIMGEAGNTELLSFIKRKLTEELLAEYPQLEKAETFSATLLSAVYLTGNKFIMIIDEWDAPIREKPEIQKMYLEFLRTLFKSSGTTDRIFAAVYMTGILPVKKDGSQSAISDFKEFTVVKPRKFGDYVGFTEEEVRKLCEDHHTDFTLMKQWYDGYSFRGVGSVYNPNSVMEAIRNDDFDSYWTQTSAAESLMGYISLDFDGLSKTVAELIGGGEVKTDTKMFANDLVTFRNKDDVLTLLIHLGYLAYDEATEKVRIPNEEIRMEFVKIVRDVKKDDTIRRVRESDQLKMRDWRGIVGYQDKNAETIDRWIEEGWEWGIPVSHETYLRALAGDWSVLLTPTKPVPREWFGDLKGKKILGLASGGGQQMPVFTAAGAKCTVLDYSKRQLESERMVAEREGYAIEIIRADMTRRLPFADESFDLIFHPVSNCYVEEVKPIFRECYRILKEGGILLAGLDNGMNFIFSEDEQTVQNTLPFNPLKNEEQMRQITDEDCGVQFSHTLEEQIGGQLEAGFILTHIMEDTNENGNLKEHNIPSFVATRAVKRKLFLR